MPDLATYIEQFAANTAVPYAVLIGLALTAAGLFVWLGGLGFRNIVLGMAGFCFGFALGIIATDGKLMAGLAAAVIAVVAVFFLERIFVSVLSISLAAALAFIFFINRPEGLNFTKGFFKEMPPEQWAIIAIIVLLAAAAGCFLYKVTAAACYSVLGTLLILSGMIILTFLKGTMPAEYIRQNTQVFNFAFAAMALFGTAVQSIFCMLPFKSKSKAEPQPPQPQSVRNEWRRSS